MAAAIDGHAVRSAAKDGVAEPRPHVFPRIAGVKSMKPFQDNARPRSQYSPASNGADGTFFGGGILFAFFCLSLVLVFWSPLVSLFRLALQSDNCTHILLVPFVSLFLIYLDRRRVFQNLKSSYLCGTLVFLAGAGVYLVSRESLPQITLSFVVILIAGFIFCFGATAFRKAIFPLLFLVLMVPLTGVVLDKVEYSLQAGSATMAYQLFRLLSVPVMQDHFVLQLPGFAIQVAKECSSIRSSLALFITALLAAHLYLRKPWTRFILVAVTVPLSVFKNAVRIVTLCVLAIHVNAGFLTGNLHRDGGVVFYAGALLILGALLQVLRSAEKNGTRSPDDLLPLTQ